MRIVAGAFFLSSLAFLVSGGVLAGEKAGSLTGTFAEVNPKGTVLSFWRSLAEGLGKEGELHRKLESFSISANCEIQVDGKRATLKAIEKGSVVKVGHKGTVAYSVVAYTPLFWDKMVREQEKEEREMRLAEAILLSQLRSKEITKRQKEIAALRQQAIQNHLAYLRALHAARTSPYPPASANAPQLQYAGGNDAVFAKILFAGASHMMREELRRDDDLFSQFGAFTLTKLRDTLIEGAVRDIFPKATRQQINLVTILVSQTLDGRLTIPNIRADADRKDFVGQIRQRFAQQATGAEDQALFEIANFLFELQQFRNQAIGRN